MNNIFDNAKHNILDSEDTIPNNSDITNKISNVKKKNHIRYVNISTIVVLLVWLVLCVFVYKLLIKKTNIEGSYFIILCIIPIPCILYHMKIIHHIIEKSNTIEKEKKRIIYKLKMETEFARTVPIIIFGLCLALGPPFKIDMKLSAFPFLLLGLIFGCIIPYYISLVSFPESNIEKLLIFETMEFSLESFSLTFLFLAICAPFYLSIKNYSLL